MTEYKLTMIRKNDGSIKIGSDNYSVDINGGLREILTDNERKIRSNMFDYAKTRIIYETVSRGKALDKLELTLTVNIE